MTDGMPWLCCRANAALCLRMSYKCVTFALLTPGSAPAERADVQRAFRDYAGIEFRELLSEPSGVPPCRMVAAGRRQLRAQGRRGEPPADLIRECPLGGG